METLKPYNIIEQIPYNNLQDIKYLTKGGFWIGCGYKEWDSKEQQLKRDQEYISYDAILKGLENVKSAEQSWFEEVCNLILFKRS